MTTTVCGSCRRVDDDGDDEDLLTQQRPGLKLSLVSANFLPSQMDFAPAAPRRLYSPLPPPRFREAGAHCSRSEEEGESRWMWQLHTIDPSDTLQVSCRITP